MANLKGVLKCTQEQYNRLLAGEALTIGGKTYTYDENVLYVTDDTQAELTDAQLAAINSGITSEKVTQIETNTTNIASLQTQIGNIDTLLTQIDSGSGV